MTYLSLKLNCIGLDRLYSANLIECNKLNMKNLSVIGYVILSSVLPLNSCENAYSKTQVRSIWDILAEGKDHSNDDILQWVTWKLNQLHNKRVEKDTIPPDTFIVKNWIGRWTRFVALKIDIDPNKSNTTYRVYVQDAFNTQILVYHIETENGKPILPNIRLEDIESTGTL